MKRGNNPVIQNRGICDPHLHVFDGKMYMYCSHDVDRCQTNYAMTDWCICSSDDLVHWEIESFPRPEDTYIGPTEGCWATDAAQRNGKYYFYFSHANISTGVMVSDHPGKGFVDALGEPLLPEGLTLTRSYDPTVFIDDDEAQTPYIMFGTPVWAGGDSYYIARLNDDMVSLAEQPRKVKLNHEGSDKPALHKYNGLYYLTYGIHYATAENVYGPYLYRGFIGSSIDHGNFVEWNNQWFQSFTIFDPTIFYRGSGLCYIHYKDNGEMVADPMIMEYGVGQYEATWNRIEAEWYMAGDKMRKKELPYYGFCVEGEDGGYIRFPHIHDMPENAGICFFAGSLSWEGGRIEVRKDTPDGELLGSCDIPYTGTIDLGGFDFRYCPLKNVAGDADLCFVFRGGKDNYPVVIDWFRVYENMEGFVSDRPY